RWCPRSRDRPRNAGRAARPRARTDAGPVVPSGASAGSSGTRVTSFEEILVKGDVEVAPEGDRCIVTPRGEAPGRGGDERHGDGQRNDPWSDLSDHDVFAGSRS